MVSSEDLKTMLEVQQKAYRDATELLMVDIGSRMRLLEQRNQELVHSLEFTQKEMEDLKKENKTLKEDLLSLKKEVVENSNVEEKIRKINDRLDYQEDYSRRNNLRFDGLDEKPNESWEETQVIIQRVLHDRLNLGSVELERAHRVGPKVPSGTARPRTVVARFKSFADRQQALRNSPRLRNTHIYINEDLCDSSVQVRKAQLPQLKKAREEGKIAYFNHTKLIVKERKESSATSSNRGAAAADSGVAAGPQSSLSQHEGPSSQSEEALQEDKARSSRPRRKNTK